MFRFLSDPGNVFVLLWFLTVVSAIIIAISRVFY
jgi:hypothetical protein